MCFFPPTVIWEAPIYVYNSTRNIIINYNTVLSAIAAIFSSRTKTGMREYIEVHNNIYSIEQYHVYNNLQNFRARRENGYDVPISRDSVGKVSANLSHL